MGLTVNRKLLPPKAHYMLYFGGVAAFWNYIAVFGKQLGLTESHVGYIFAVAPIAGIISMPLFGSIADRFKIKKKLFLVFNVINLFAILLFACLTTENKIHRPVSIECNVGSSFVRHCHSSEHSWDSEVIRTKVLDELTTKTDPILCSIHCLANKTDLTKFCTDMDARDIEKPLFCMNTNSTSEPIPFSLVSELEFKEIMPEENCISIKIKTIETFDSHQVPVPMPTSCISQNTLNNCMIDCPNLRSANAAMQEISTGNETEESKLPRIFWLYATFTIIGWIAMAVVTSVADALCFQSLGDRPDLYGHQRKWGSVGWGLFTLISGLLVDVVSGDSEIKNYNPCYWIAGSLLTLNLIVCWKWDVVEEERPKALGRRMVALLTEPKITVFIFACVVVGICTGLLWNFLFWYIEDLAQQRMYTHGYMLESRKWIKLLQGLISIVQCFCGELPFFYLAGKFLNKFGHVNSMALVIGTFGVRFLLYSVLQNPWWVLPIELLQGLTYGIFYANMATYAYVVSPEGTAATVQGIVGAAFEGFGVSFGSLMGGLMYEHLSARTTFRLFGVFALVMCIVYKCVMMTIDRKFTPLPQDSENGHHPETEMRQMKKPSAFNQS